MKRFHVHVAVADVQASVAFYSRLFAAEPVRLEQDYAKWMLEDPRLNFAISSRGGAPGLDHLGFQVDSDAELVQMKAAAECADLPLQDEGQTTCCYARSDKHWIVDPSGLPWEHFHTLEQVPVFGAAAASVTGSASGGSCCGPALGAGKSGSTSAVDAGQVQAGSSGSSCCAPSKGGAAKSGCCG